MAWSSSQINAALQSAYKNDKPILFGHNALEGTTQSGWRTWTTSPSYDFITDYTGYILAGQATYTHATKVITLTSGTFAAAAAGDKFRVTTGAYDTYEGTVASVDASLTFLTLTPAGLVGATLDMLIPPFDWTTYQAAGAFGSFEYTGFSVTPEYTTPSPNYDAANASYPLYRAWDNSTNAQTEAALPGSLTDTDRWSALFQVPASEFDAIAVINHNLGTLSNFYGYNANPANPDFDVFAHIADDDEFSTNVRKVFTWKNPASNRPLVAFDLTYPQTLVGTPFMQYSGVTNIQLSMVCPSATMGTGTGQPRIGEVMFGKRVQLRHQASVPYSDKGLYADAITEAPDTGQFVRYARSSGGMKFNTTYTIGEEHDDVASWFESHIDYGVKHFLYVPRPSKAVGEIPFIAHDPAVPMEAYWVALQEGAFSLTPAEGPLGWELQLTMKETAPYNEGLV